MIVLLFTALAMQVAGWSVVPATATVGDTVQLTRRVTAQPGVHPHVQHLSSSYLVEPLMHPTVGYAEGAVIVRYTVAFFAPGEHAIEMPDIELSYPDGRVERVFGDTARVGISSVIQGAGDSLPEPAAWVPPLERDVRLPWLPLLPLATVLSLFVAWIVGWRRVSPRPSWVYGQGKSIYAPVERWIRAGELRAGISAVTDRLRDRIERDLPDAGRQLSTAECMRIVADQRPDWPVRDIEDTLRALDRARFAPALPSDVVVLAEQVEDLMTAMAQAAAD